MIVRGLAEGMCGKIPHFQINNGNDADMEYMLARRDNLGTVHCWA